VISNNAKSNLAIFASGSGSNAQKIIEYFDASLNAEIGLVVSNRAEALVLERAHKAQIDTQVFSNSQFKEGTEVIRLLQNLKIDYIILAGFLLKIPIALIRNFPRKIINIHPALLPKYGGKGMYGKHVHQAVFDHFEVESGITIHYVNEAYDEGQIIFQKSVTLELLDTPDIIATKVLALEHHHYPRVIDNLLTLSN